ncbi:ubiquinone biosynthesis O-methyltransferase, mitochondrial isoform X3 [Salvia miltiorrhiza]|uniref:ubiquinone biosynthesis O-methyltransferase, mitochondrial isoform X3 n=1 Tax=Salvia miltiorrhiza TaxID=226208 RepID=UPI0025ABCC84|nr:ubiquinone biosynthesis O-methyltransferase, mitochondrial isoform X3 [Salvia miltiorrhiza]
MMSKHILARLRPLTRPACRSSQPANYTTHEFHHKLQSRRYSDSPLPSPAAPAPTPPPSAKIYSKSSLNEAELKKFAAISETWWDAEGPFKPLHVMNPTRLAFIRSMLCRHFGKDPSCSRPFEGLKFVDVGCGGGILSEPLARMGAHVTGVDAVEKNIKIAQLHAKNWWKSRGNLMLYLHLRCTPDCLHAIQVIEHVADPADFCKSLSALTESGGATLISTINRSMRAYATAIVVAEYVLRWLPAGTHDWSSFLTPEELVLILQRASISVQEMAGFVYNPLTGRWSLSDDIGVNFIAYGTKNHE